MMGIGQVVTVKIPASELRTLNLSIERGAWGAFTTEFYPTYDYVPIWKEQKRLLLHCMENTTSHIKYNTRTLMLQTFHMKIILMSYVLNQLLAV
jgi:hypothetical protein